ncbi:MAG: hypothetical protein QOH32_3537 [Bradyrhizobium sp.]|jgi:hypothetical protein|nr:hypothetical protein [Bradyrhizobium sp.]
MITEQTQKQLLFITGAISTIGGVVTALGGAAGNFTEVFGKFDAFSKLSVWQLCVVSGILCLLGLWLLIKWRTRHSRLLIPDALRLDRDNADHLVGRADDVDNLLQRCLLKQIVFLEGESGSGKSALVRSGLLPKLKNEKSVIPLVLADLWVDHWELGPFQALKVAMTNSGAFVNDPAATTGESGIPPTTPAPPPPATVIATLADIEERLTRLAQGGRTALIVFDQFDDYQARNRDRFLPNKIWLSPDAFRRQSPFWNMVARLLEQEKIRGLFVTRSDTAAGLSSVQFLGAVEALRLDRVKSTYIAELLTRLTKGTPEAPVIKDPDAGWNKLQERIVRDISHQDVVLPQQLKIMLGGIHSLKQLNIAQYERAGGASGIEALYVEQQITGTARKVMLEAGQVRAILVALIDPDNPNKTWSRSKQQLAAANNPPIAEGKLDSALQELERGEMLRSASDPQSGVTAYRLDHDYLTRGVAAAERRANQWYYLLADGATAFQNAGSMATRWKALLPVGAQCRLAWERLRGTLRYGQQSNYAAWSVARFAPLALLLAVLGAGAWAFGYWREQQAATETARKILLQLEFRKGIGDRELEGAWTLATTSDVRVQAEFITQLLGTPEYAEHFLLQPDLVVQAVTRASPVNRNRVLLIAGNPVRGANYDARTIAAIALALRLGNLGFISPGSIVDGIKVTKDADQLRPLGAALAAISPQLKQDDAFALATAVVDAIKGSLTRDQFATLAAPLGILANQLKPEDAHVLARPMIELIRTTDEIGLRRNWTRTFTSVAVQLKPEHARSLALAILEAQKNAKEEEQRDLYTQALAALVPRLKPDDVVALARPIAEEIKQAKSGDQVRRLSRTLAAIVPGIGADDAFSLLSPIADIMLKTKDKEQRDLLVQAFAAMASRLGPDNALVLAQPIMDTITAADADERNALARTFVAIVPLLKPEARKIITDPIIDAMNKALKDPDPLAFIRNFSFNVVLVAPHLSSQDASSVAHSITEWLVLRPGYLPSTFVSYLLRTLADLAPQLTPEDAYSLLTPVTDRVRYSVAFGRDQDFSSSAFGALASRLYPEDAYAVGRPIVARLKDTIDRDSIRIFASLAPQMKSENLKTLADLIVEVAKNAKTTGQLSALGSALAAVAPQLKPEDARTCAGLMMEAMEQMVDDDMVEAAKSTVALARQLPWPERLKLLASLLKYPNVYGKSRDVLITAIKEHPEARNIQPPGDIWATVEWLKPRRDIDLDTPPRRAKTANR